MRRDASIACSIPCGCLAMRRLVSRGAPDAPGRRTRRAGGAMRFYEYESKQLFARHGIPLPKGSRVARTPDEAQAIAREIAAPVVLKSQVLTGGRMKAGGVLFADD